MSDSKIYESTSRATKITEGSSKTAFLLFDDNIDTKMAQNRQITCTHSSPTTNDQRNSNIVTFSDLHKRTLHAVE